MSRNGHHVPLTQAEQARRAAALAALKTEQEPAIAQGDVSQYGAYAAGIIRAFCLCSLLLRQFGSNFPALISQFFLLFEAGKR